jgi:hypothetical protein
MSQAGLLLSHQSRFRTVAFEQSALYAIVRPSALGKPERDVIGSDGRIEHHAIPGIGSAAASSNCLTIDRRSSFSPETPLGEAPSFPVGLSTWASDKGWAA